MDFLNKFRFSLESAKIKKKFSTFSENISIHGTSTGLFSQSH